MRTLTPGLMAYAAYVVAVERRPVAHAVTVAMWARLLPAQQRAWEAVARAVLAWRDTTEEEPRDAGV